MVRQIKLVVVVSVAVCCYCCVVLFRKLSRSDLRSVMHVKMLLIIKSMCLSPLVGSVTFGAKVSFAS